MSRRLVLGVVLLLLVSCGGGDDASLVLTTTSTSSVTPTTTSSTTSSSTTTTTSTSSTTTTTTAPTTTTTTLPPPAIEAWGGDGPGTIALVFAEEYDAIDVVVEGALRAMGIAVDDDAPVVLEVEVETISYYIDYDQGRCFKGAAVEGTVTLTDTTATHDTLRATVDGEYPPPPFMFGNCDRPDPDDAPFDYAFEPGFVEIAVAWWGEGSVPYLTGVLDADHYVFDARLGAVQALRLMEWGRIPRQVRYEALHAALEFASRITHMGDDVGDARTYRRAVEKLFDEAIGWEIEIPVTDNASMDSLAIRLMLDQLDVRV